MKKILSLIFFSFLIIGCQPTDSGTALQGCVPALTEEEVLRDATPAHWQQLVDECPKFTTQQSCYDAGAGELCKWE